MNHKETEASLTILLADDDSDDCLFFEKALKELTISSLLTIVRGGEELMKFLSQNTTLPNVLFLDLNMPRKNGFECLCEIKESEKLKNLYVVMFSTAIPQDKTYEREMIVSLLKLGANDFIHKTSDFQKLKQSIGETLKKVLNTIQSTNTKF